LLIVPTPVGSRIKGQRYKFQQQMTSISGGTGS
jgi:hypothetical protein